jgi:hypothetical protein
MINSMKKITWLIITFCVFIVFALVILNRHTDLKEKNKTKEYFEMDKPEGFLDYYYQITVPFNEKESGYSPNYAYLEFLKAKKANLSKKMTQSSLPWTFRGPGNVGGRTRSILLDPDDSKGSTWFAGSASGGIWKTTNAGSSWVDIAPDLPNLATTVLSMAPSNSNKIYVGTGEGYGGIGMVMGNGIFVSDDKGNSWSVLPSTTDNRSFWYVNRIWVDPADENTLIVTTNTGIYKSTDGGNSWSTKFENGYRVQDLYQNPQNSNVLYAGVNTKGIYKSTDKGETWVEKNNGFGGGKRYEVAVSNVDTNYVFAVVENNLQKMNVYLSTDGGDNWRREKESNGDFFNFHMAQGWYNSLVEPHPFNKNEAYVAGVYMGKVSFGDELSESSPLIKNVDTLGTSSFLAFINFGSGYLEGGMSTGIDEGADNVSWEDFTSVEIRFGPGKSQKAHRFLVPEGEGSGVLASNYTYQDYVDVPFEVWDTDNNTQLMVSFRDQERDGLFNLIERDPLDATLGREYLFIQAIPYDPNIPSPAITRNGGHFEKLLYFFWPTIAAGEVWDIAELPDSKVFVDFGTMPLQQVTTSIMHGPDVNVDLHVDHHDLIIIPGANSSANMKMILANDGGIAYSKTSGEFWDKKIYRYATAQFYGVAKSLALMNILAGPRIMAHGSRPLEKKPFSNIAYNLSNRGRWFSSDLEQFIIPDLILGSTYNNN